MLHINGGVGLQFGANHRELDVRNSGKSCPEGNTYISTRHGRNLIEDNRPWRNYIKVLIMKNVEQL